MAQQDVFHTDNLLSPAPSGDIRRPATQAAIAPFRWACDLGTFVVEERDGVLLARMLRADSATSSVTIASPAGTEIVTGQPAASAVVTLAPQAVRWQALNLVEAKLAAPLAPVRDVTIPRPRASASLHEALDYPLTTLVAPAGWGKTTLLAQWLQASLFAWTWLTLDAADNWPPRFITYLLAALDRLRPGLLTELHASATASQNEVPEAILSAILVALAAAPDPTIVVIDDVHYVAADNRPIRDALTFLIEHAPPHVHFVLASRSERALPFARLHAGGRLHALQTADLRWTREEASAYLVGQLGLPLSDHQVALLMESTEGWITGLRLAGHALQHSAEIAGAIQSFSGNYHYIADYFDTEYLQHLQPDQRDFVLLTSILDRFNAPLCDAVCKIDGSQRLLDVLERDNPFLCRLDELRHWYRYHHLLADVLRQHLYAKSPELVPELHRRASAWFEAQGDPGAALLHAVRAHNDERVASLVERFPAHAVAPALRGPVGSWLCALSEVTLQERPSLRAVLALFHFLTGTVEQAERTIAALPASMSQPVSDNGQNGRLFVARLDALRSVVALNASDRLKCYAKSRAALASLAQADPFRHLAVLTLGIAHLMDGEIQTAIRVLHGIQQPVPGAESDALSISHAAYLGYACLLSGRLAAARQICLRAQAAAAPASRAGSMAAVDTVLGLIHLERDELNQAEECLNRGLATLSCWQHYWLASEGYAALALLCHMQGRPVAARAALARLEQAPVPTHSWTARATDVTRATLLIREGNVEAAGIWARSVERRRGAEHTRPAGELKRDDTPVSLDLHEQTALARIYVLEGHAYDAVPLLAKTLEVAAAAGNCRLALEALTLLAGSYSARGDHATAEAILTRALMIAQQRGFRRAMVDAAAGVPAILAQMRACAGASQGMQPHNGAREHTDLRDHVNPAMTSASARRDAPVRTPGRAPVAGHSPHTAERSNAALLVAPRLRLRELEVLQLLAAGASNKDLARELAITLGTAKRHVANIFLALTVRSRTQAIARARALHLIDDDIAIMEGASGMSDPARQRTPAIDVRRGPRELAARANTAR